jgi:hypothetical protein
MANRTEPKTVGQWIRYVVVAGDRYMADHLDVKDPWASTSHDLAPQWMQRKLHAN